MTNYYRQRRRPKPPVGPEWYEPRHRLWERFRTAMIPAILHEVDWQQYKRAHDLHEDPELQDEIDRVAKLLED